MLPEKVLSGWEDIVGLLPEDLESSARTCGTFVRPRNVDSATTLLRLVLAYSLTPMSFRQTVAWAEANRIATLSDVSLIERMENCTPWLLHLISQMITPAKSIPQISHLSGIHLLDATSVTAPDNSQWKLHLAYDAHAQAFRQVQVKDSHTGESLSWLRPQPNVLTIADRAYEGIRQIDSLVQQGGLLLCRLKASRYLEQADKQSIVTVNHRLGRVIIAPIPEEKQAKVAQRVKRKAQKKQRKLHPKTLEANQFVCLFCNDPNLSPQEIVALYRWRWQVELAFKRLKSLQGLDDMTVKHPKLCEVYLLCHVLVSLFTEKLNAQAERFFPPRLYCSGYRPGDSGSASTSA